MPDQPRPSARNHIFGRLFVSASSEDDCPQCTWFVKAFYDPASTTPSSTPRTASIKAHRRDPDTLCVEIRTEGGGTRGGHLFIPADDVKLFRQGLAPGTWFILIDGGEIEEEQMRACTIETTNSGPPLRQKIKIP